MNRHLRTRAGSVYAAGDCNGRALLSHAAMHQGMIALMNSLMPAPMRMDFRRFDIPRGSAMLRIGRCGRPGPDEG